MSDSVVNLSADPTNPNSGQNSGNYPFSPVALTLGAGTYSVGNIGIAQGGLYDAYSVYAPLAGNGAYTDGQWSFAYASTTGLDIQSQIDETRYNTAGQALNAFAADAPLTFTLAATTTVLFYLDDKAYPYFADDSGGVSLKVTPVPTPPPAPVPVQVVNLSASPTDPNAGTQSGGYPYNPVTVHLGPGTYTVNNIGISQGGAYDAYTVYAPTANNGAYTDGLWGFTYTNSDGTHTAVNTDETKYNTAAEALAHYSGDAPLTFTLTEATDVSFFVNDSGYPYFADDSGGVSLQITQSDPPPCFLAGTLILTVDGEVPIERLAVGDKVVVRAADGSISEQAVAWIGHRRVAAASLPADERYPVRVHANAFARGVPHRDLLVTSEHCLFWGGVMVPARMLVNGRNVTIDRSFESYAVYHLQLPHHGVLVANGMTAESYLDTGNRSNFANAEIVAVRPGFAVNGGHQSWAMAAAPLATDRATVEPLWQSLVARADEAGIAQPPQQHQRTNCPDLRLRTDLGQTITPQHAYRDRVWFTLPVGTQAVRLLSRTARPFDAIGPFVDDRRQLGVAVGEIVVSSGTETVIADAHLRESVLDGWHGLEGDTRWTNGDAFLPIESPVSKAETFTIIVQILAAGPYIVEAADMSRSQAA